MNWMFAMSASIVIEALLQAPERLRGIAVVSSEAGTEELEALGRPGSSGSGST